MKHLLNKGVINALPANGEDAVWDDTTGKQIGICQDGKDNTDDPVYIIGDPIPYGKTISVDYIDSQVEVTQLVFIGIDSYANFNEETVAAATRYGIQIIESGGDLVGIKNPEFKRAYTMPDSLSGTATTDRNSLYSTLVNRVNSYEGIDVTAYLCYKVAFTGGTTGTGVVGTTTVTPLATIPTANKVTAGSPGVQSTSTITMKVAEINITSGSIAGADAAGDIWVYDFSDVDSWDSTSETMTFTDATNSETLIVTTAAALTAGQGMVIKDDANYWWSNKSRGGISEVDLYDGFDTATARVIRTGKYSQGIANFINANELPTFSRDKLDLIEGNGYYLLDTSMTAGKEYTTMVLTYKLNPAGALDGGSVEIEKKLVIFVDESDATELAAFKAAVTTAIRKPYKDSAA